MSCSLSMSLFEGRKDVVLVFFFFSIFFCSRTVILYGAVIFVSLFEGLLFFFYWLGLGDLLVSFVWFAKRFPRSFYMFLS